MAGDLSKYRGVRWPLRLNSRGDFDIGTPREVIRGDIRTVLQTRKFHYSSRGGERLMRPGAYGLVPYALLELFDPEVVVPLVEAWLEGALGFLVDDGKITIQRISVTADYDPERLDIMIGYMVVEENTQDEYRTEIRTISPSGTGRIG